MKASAALGKASLVIVVASILVACLLLVPTGVQRKGSVHPVGSSASSTGSPARVRGPSAGCTTPFESTDPVVVDRAQVPDSLDPAVSFSTPGWGAIPQVYQGLVNYNGSSATSLVGILVTAIVVAVLLVWSRRRGESVVGSPASPGPPTNPPGST